MVQASFFATTASASAFTVASQIPNLFSNLFSQAALSAAFVPIFTELMQAGRKKEAFKLASELFWLILIGLGALTILYMGVAGLIMPLFTGTKFSAAETALTAGLSRVLFPVVLLLSLTGLMVGILQSYDEFSIPALGAGRLERGDRRPDGHPACPLPWRGCRLLVCHRLAGGHGRADADDLRRAQESIPVAVQRELKGPAVRQVLILFCRSR